MQSHTRQVTTAKLTKQLESSSQAVPTSRDEIHAGGAAAFSNINTKQSKCDR